MKEPASTKQVKKLRKQSDKKMKKTQTKSIVDAMKKASSDSSNDLGRGLGPPSSTKGEPKLSSKPKGDVKKPWLNKPKSQGNNFVPGPKHKFKKPSYAELKEQKLTMVYIDHYFFFCSPHTFVSFISVLSSFISSSLSSFALSSFRSSFALFFFLSFVYLSFFLFPLFLPFFIFPLFLPFFLFIPNSIFLSRFVCVLFCYLIRYHLSLF